MNRPKRITLEVGDELYRFLKVRCAMDGRPISQAVREVLERTYGRKPPVKRQATRAPASRTTEKEIA